MQTLFDKHAPMIDVAADLDREPDKIDAPDDDTDDSDDTPLCSSCCMYGCDGCDRKPPANRIRGQAK